MNVSQSPEWQYTVVDVADNSTTVYSGPCIVKAMWVQTVLSAHVCPILDGAVPINSFAASAAVGTEIDFHGVKFVTSLIVDPNDSGTGKIIVVWKANHDGVAGTGYSGA
jgi:hypothetical protein